MKREIEFRAKTVEGEWLYGGYVKCNNREYILPDIDLVSREWVFKHIEVIPETIGQFTGLTDKNGKKIFECDTVKFTDTTFGYSHIGEVCFDKGSFCILYEFYGQKKLHRIGKTNKWQDMGASGNITYSYEVIGNIYDNPELLGE
jgi:uncharacterized phage protein (TIGR01671 family)